MSNINFYSQLKLIQDFQSIAELKYYQDVPADWVVIITDVVMSTRAIENGLYKNVNTVGALAIAAVLNAIKNVEIPFIFGGDGATLLIPKSHLYAAKDALLHTRQMANKEYSLDLRIGVVDVQKIIDDGHIIKIAKLAISPTYDQAILAGSGIDYAEKLVKHPVQGQFYSLGNGKPLMEANYSGFTCRWEDIPSRHGETISLIVKVTESTLETEVEHYSQIIKVIRKIYGESHEHHPIHFDGLNLTFGPARLSVEANAITSNIFQRSVLLTRIFLENTIGKISTMQQKSFMGFSMQKHRQKMVLSSDYKKFDGSLKMVISGTTAQRLELEDYLNKLVEKGFLIYGIHVSDRALLTCLVFDGSGKEVHFVDSADGGYALAAKKIKAKA